MRSFPKLSEDGTRPWVRFRLRSSFFSLQSDTQVLGVENVENKISQGIELFESVGIALNRADTLEVGTRPAVLHEDCRFLHIEASGGVADLITIFYLSGEMIADPRTLQTCGKLLREGGQILLSTEVGKNIVQQHLSAMEVHFRVKILEVPKNFEQTAIILS